MGGFQLRCREGGDNPIPSEALLATKYVHVHMYICNYCVVTKFAEIYNVNIVIIIPWIIGDKA